MDITTSLKDIFEHAVKAVDPYDCVRLYLEDHPEKWEKGVYVSGFGKAASRMAMACEDVVGDKIRGGTLITKYGHAEKLHMLELFEGGHPVPDENCLEHSLRIVDLIDRMSQEDELLCLISGGGSALFCKPYEGISLNDKQKTTDILLKAGADIFELNAVRKHISDVKGGRFLNRFKGKKMTSLILSDVLGDRLDVIASGPTTYDESTFQDALEAIRKYDLENDVPENVIRLLKDGTGGVIPETLKYGEGVLERVDNVIIGSLSVAIKAAQERALSLGMDVVAREEFVDGEASVTGKEIAKRVKEQMSERNIRPLCIISGGETTVTVKGSGKGGRNMELALSFAREINGVDGVTMISAGTDGGDGPTDAAGAIVDGKTIQRAEEMGLSAEKYLSINDSYNFFKRTDELFITGPTGTNVMDIQIVIVQ
jgi:glycerate-2-kinase